MWEGRGLHPAGRCRSSGAWAEGFCSTESPRPLGSSEESPVADTALIGFHKAEEMRPVTSRDNDLQTKEETCTEAVFSFTWGISGQRNVNTELWLGAGSWGEGWQGKEKSSWQTGTAVGTSPAPGAFFRWPRCSPRMHQLKGLFTS